MFHRRNEKKSTHFGIKLTIGALAVVGAVSIFCCCRDKISNCCDKMMSMFKKKEKESSCCPQDN